MTTELITMWRCDHPVCSAVAVEGAEGWTDAIYTHGCPSHGSLIEAHKAKVTSDTRGRGAREKTTWYLTCACGWMPKPYFATHSYRGLATQHVAHVRDAAGQEARDA